MKLTAIGKRVASAFGVEVRRAGRTNRFDAMAHTLALVRSRGFRPTLVIDAGANVGNWTKTAAALFPEARFALVEPQSGCRPSLEAFQPPRFQVHHVALTAPGVTEVSMAGADARHSSAGAFVAENGSAAAAGADVATYPASTLDTLFASQVTDADRVLLKLDLEGHELVALQGATALLPRVDVVVTEVTFFDIYRMGTRVVFAEVFKYFDEQGFELYDFAMLLGRNRDQRLIFGDAVLVRKGCPLLEDVSPV